MKQKGFSSLGMLVIVIIVVLVSVAGYFVFLQKPTSPSIAKIPTIDLEATIITLSIDTDGRNCAGRCPGSKYPQDSAVIKVNKIDASKDPQRTVRLTVGDEISVKFRYSARPAKLIRDSVLAEQSTSDEPETPTSYTSYLARPIPIEEGYFIYYLPIHKEAEKTLPGLKEGDQIKITDFYSLISIGEYEIVN